MTLINVYINKKDNVKFIKLSNYFHFCKSKFLRNMTFLIPFLIMNTLISINVAANSIGVNEGEYYFGYGDSIMRSMGYGDCDVNVNDCFVNQMRDLYDISATVDHNIDGGGKTSWWGSSNFISHYSSENKYIIFMFGANDDQEIYEGYKSISDHVQSMLDIYNQILETGSTPILCITPLKQNNTKDKPWNNYNDMTSRMQALMDTCENYSIPYVKIFDALDSNPGNGKIDYWDSKYYCDHVHPNKNGHRKMAEYLWIFINKSDISMDYRFKIDVNYNETSYIQKTVNWDYNNISLLNNKNNTKLDYDQRYGNLNNFNDIKNYSYSIFNSNFSKSNVSLVNKNRFKFEFVIIFPLLMMVLFTLNKIRINKIGKL